MAIIQELQRDNNMGIAANDLYVRTFTTSLFYQGNTKNCLQIVLSYEHVFPWDVYTCIYQAQW